MINAFRLIGLIVLSHTLYDLLKDDRKEWVSSIRKYVARKWNEAEQRVINGPKGA